MIQSGKNIGIEKETVWKISVFEALIITAVTAFAGQHYLYNEKNAGIGMLLFISAAAVFIYAALAEKKMNLQAEKQRSIALKQEIILFSLIILTAGFFRFYQLDSLPSGSHRDEAKAALDSLYISGGKQPEMADSKLPVYIKGITDNPAAYNYIMAVFYKFHPSGAVTGRLATAFLGVLGVAAMYFLSRSLLGVNYAVIAGFMLAFSRWHFTFTRHMLHAGFLVFIMLLAVYFCVKAYRDRKTFYFIAAGLCSALVLYTFQAGRAFVPLLAACGIYIMATDRNFITENRRKIISAAFVFMLAAAPLLFYALANPGSFTKRAAELFLFAPENMAQSGGAAGAAALYFGNLGKAFLMFNKAGSAHLFYNYNFAPMLDFTTGVFFMIGFFYSLYMIFAGSRMHAMLVLMLAAGLHGTVLFIEAPHATRAVMAMPAVILIAAAAMEKAAAMAYSFTEGRAGKFVLLVIALLLFASASQNYHIYFELFKKDRLAWDAFSADSRQAGIYLKKLGPGWNAVLDPRYFENYESYSFRLETAGINGVSIEKFDFNRHADKGELRKADNVFLMGKQYKDILSRLEQRFPEGILEPVYETYNPGQVSFYSFRVTANNSR